MAQGEKQKANEHPTRHRRASTCLPQADRILNDKKMKKQSYDMEERLLEK